MNYVADENLAHYRTLNLVDSHIFDKTAIENQTVSSTFCSMSSFCSGNDDTRTPSLQTVD